MGFLFGGILIQKSTSALCIGKELGFTCFDIRLGRALHIPIPSRDPVSPILYTAAPLFCQEGGYYFNPCEYGNKNPSKA